jgi:hypothetical protein
MKLADRQCGVAADGAELALMDYAVKVLRSSLVRVVLF